MPKNLHKVQKQVAKKRGGKTNTLNENSRDAKRLQQAVQRGEKLARQVKERAKANELYLERIRFFKELFAKTNEPYTDPPNENIHYAAHLCTRRNNSAIWRLKAERKHQRPPTAREEKLENIENTETQELRSGYWMPDLTDRETIRKLQQWDGQWSSLATMKFVRIGSKDGAPRLMESSFPPKGMS